MSTQSEAQTIVQYIRSLSGFELVPPGYPYNHMGATITDAILQAGQNWRTVVKPRIEKVKQYPTAKTTSGFISTFSSVGLKVLID